MNKQNSVLRDALKILRIKEVSEFNLRQALEKKGYRDPELSETINYLKSKNFLSDYRLCSLIIEKNIKKKRGLNYIRYFLANQGVPEHIISETLARMYPESLEYNIAKELVLSLKKPFRRVLYILNSRGFSEQTIEKLKGEISEEQ
ncbi:MAG TPA: regulatory protein RecX [bacterium]|nr:regulatory protein RecX [bacterium]